ncbi:PREDICTED: uncharacterized protein K02A2.6-like [Acropora digitifera]|uniref:uncharacterized protein K02A2.6-like n=1 Tax=Acropora digitifera TaxID=70779 RepID=UPI00077A65B8|nr:PREDICTED: uncharacterized protein K02A2.6-like [Acropora digitifera]
MKPDSQPKFCKAYPVPYALQEAVDAEYHRLESEVSNSLPEDVFVKLRGGIRFTKLDLRNAYQQLPLDPDSQQFVTINTHRGLYRHKRSPFGIASSPAIFQRTTDIILHPNHGQG